MDRKPAWYTVTVYNEEGYLLQEAGGSIVDGSVEMTIHFGKTGYVPSEEINNDRRLLAAQSLTDKVLDVLPAAAAISVWTGVAMGIGYLMIEQYLSK